MNKIYLNQDICKDLYVSYDGYEMLRASADMLLIYNTFDESHRKLFQKNAGKTLKLTRRESDLPGWFRVETL